MKKTILRKLMDLGTTEADAQLKDFAISIEKDIKSHTNVEGSLDLLEQFVYKVSEKTIEIAEHILFSTSKFTLESKIKALSLVSHLRYIAPKETLIILHRVYLSNSDNKLRDKAVDAFSRFVKFDFNFINKFRHYLPQREALNFIQKIPGDQKLPSPDFILAGLKEILSSSVEGTTWSSENTMTMHSGMIDPSSEGLNKMRHEAIDFLFDMYVSSADDYKLKIVSTLGEVTQTPNNVAYDDDYVEMLKRDIVHLSKVYSDMIYGKSGKIIAPLAVVLEIGNNLSWVNRTKFKSDDSVKLSERIEENPEYKMFRVLVGDAHGFIKPKESWDSAEKRREEEYQKILEGISNEDVGILKNIADQLRLGFIDEWRFQFFKRLLCDLNKDKSIQASKIFQESLEKADSLSQQPFIASYFNGLRRNKLYDLWDQAVGLIVDKKRDDLLSSVVFSINPDKDADLNEVVREEDLKILESIIKKEKPYDFSKEGDRLLHHALINTLARLFKRNPKRIEGFIVTEMRSNSEYLDIYTRELPFLIWRDWVDFKDWSEENINFLKEKFIEVADLDWHMQEMLLKLRKDSFGLALDIFKGRITRKILKEKESDNRYDSIPYHFNPDLQKYLIKHKNYIKEMISWVEDMTEKWSIYNWEVSHFIQRIGGDPVPEIIKHFASKGGKENLKKAFDILHAFERIDLELAFEIIKQTDEKNIIDSVGGALASTGIVSGEYGIARSYESRAIELGNYTNNENARVKAFAVEWKKYFENSAQREYKRAKEQKALRKIEFEG